MIAGVGARSGPVGGNQQLLSSLCAPGSLGLLHAVGPATSRRRWPDQRASGGGGTWLLRPGASFMPEPWKEARRARVGNVTSRQLRVARKSSVRRHGERQSRRESPSPQRQVSGLVPSGVCRLFANITLIKQPNSDALLTLLNLSLGPSCDCFQLWECDFHSKPVQRKTLSHFTLCVNVLGHFPNA